MKNEELSASILKYKCEDTRKKFHDEPRNNSAACNDKPNPATQEALDLEMADK